MLGDLIDTSGWTHEQFLAAIILAFIVITILVVLKRIIGLFKLAKKRPYRPNLRPLRRTRHKTDGE